MPCVRPSGPHRAALQVWTDFFAVAAAAFFCQDLAFDDLGRAGVDEFVDRIWASCTSTLDPERAAVTSRKYASTYNCFATACRT